MKDEQHNAFQGLLTFDESLLYSSGHFSSRNELISCIVAMLHGVEVLTYLPTLYLYKDDFKISPALLTFILGLIRLPLNSKLLLAFMSDSVPIFGSRRKSYLAIGSFICFSSMFVLGLLNESYSIVLTTLLFALCSLGSALCSVIGEALVIECAYKQSTDQVTKTISTFYTFRKLTFAAMSYLSSVLMMIIKKREIFMISSSLPFCVFFTSFFIQEKPFGYYLTIKEQYNRLVSFASKPEIKNPSIFLFISMIVPSAGTAMFYFMTERLHFQPEIFGRFSAFQAIASLFGIYCYLLFFRNISIRRLFVWTTYLVAAFCSLSIVLVKRWNVVLGIPDKAFAITDTSLIQFIGEMNSFPIYVMATRLCPRGIESSMYSFLWTVQFLGMDISTYISSGLTHLFGIQSHNFKGLVPMIVVCAAAQLIPNFFVSLLPKELPTVQMDDDVTATIDEAEEEGQGNEIQAGSEIYVYKFCILVVNFYKNLVQEWIYTMLESQHWNNNFTI
uniref:BT1 family, putative n=1 Tax=Theileria annulata TaxID=5874 RepID=A0A3B0N6U8_THEAN